MYKANNLILAFHEIKALVGVSIVCRAACVTTLYRLNYWPFSYSIEINGEWGIWKDENGIAI
jgi:hypothetical protein